METHNQTSQGTHFGLIEKTSMRLLIAPIRAYQFLLSPWLGNHCRFHPSCSHYAVDAINEHGASKGLILTLCRLSKCHPWHEGGFDPVPLNISKQKMVSK